MRSDEPIEPRSRPAGRFVIVSLLIVLLLIVAGVAALVYVVATHRVKTNVEVSQNHEWQFDEGRDGDIRVHRTLFEAPIGGSRRIEADVEVAAGHVQTGVAENGRAFQAEVSLTTEELRPIFSHEQRNATTEVSLDLEGSNVGFSDFRSTRGNTWRLYFSDTVPLDLSLSLGAADAMLDLTGIPLEQLELDSGMASTRLRFGQPNPVVLRRMDIKSGLSEFRAEGLGNARFESFTFDGGAGDFTLDFSGDEFIPGAVVEINVGMASLTVLLPNTLPTRLETTGTFMTSFDVPSSFVKTGRSVWLSPNAEGNPDVVTLQIKSGPGSVDVRLVE